MSTTRTFRPLAFRLAAAAAAMAAAFLLDDVLLKAVPALGAAVDAAPTPLRTSLMRWLGLFHFAGNVEPWLFVAVALALATRSGAGGGRRAVRVLVLVLGSVLLAGLGSEALKLVVRRERPGAASGRFARRPFAVETFRTSPLTFPSGHAAVAAAGSTAVAILSPPVAPAMLVLAGGCGLHRVLSGSHFPSDVVGGWLLGWAVALAAAKRLRPDPVRGGSMTRTIVPALAVAAALAAPAAAAGPAPRLLLNHVGFDTRSPMRLVIAAPESAGLASAALVDEGGRTRWRGPVRRAGAVDGWKGRFFWSVEIGEVPPPGRYRVVVRGAAGTTASEPFEAREGLLADTLVPDVLHYLKSRRASGEVDAFDRAVPFFGGRPGTVDVHGGWFDASGDEGKYLTHLSYATYMNPQQQSQVVWSLLAARDLLARSTRERLRAMAPRAEDEARHGADFLVRMQDPEGYFYTTVHDVWTHVPANRTICSFRLQTGVRDERYRAGYRMGAGAAIAALARASALGGGGELPASRYLEAAVKGFRHLEARNTDYLNDGRENIIDDYTALLAASELYRATGEAEYLAAARRRAASLSGRLASDGRCRDFWRADESGARPFWHAVEAGLPVVALLRYLEVEPDATRAPAVRRVVEASLAFELAITSETVNPFGLARQYVSDAGGRKRSSFFMPHENESGYWWQGENARLASLAAAALLGARVVPPSRREALRRYAVDQVDWVLGRNPFDVCMLQGRGRNAPDYLPGFPNAPGGICNGITSGFGDERDIAFLPPPHDADPSHNWRWSEQWLPHDAWMLLALAALE